MSEEVFVQAVDMSIQLGLPIVLGGGEPTLHEQFWDFLEIAIDRAASHQKKTGQSLSRVDVTTNGSLTKSALKLAQMAKEGKLFAGLSIDKWHDPIDPVVVRAFVEGKEQFPYISLVAGVDSDFRLIRTVPTETLCACPIPHVIPSGMVRACGCMDSPVCGHISEVDKMPFKDLWRCCYGRDVPRSWTYSKAQQEEAAKLLQDALEGVGFQQL